MTVTYEDILTAICTEVKPLSANDSQLTYALNNPKEAQLAYDILAAHGFDVRVYHEAQQASKLYIARAANDPPAYKLDSAYHYAATLKEILGTMGESDNGDYQMTFSNTPTQGKQISIYFPPAKTETTKPSPSSRTLAANSNTKFNAPAPKKSYVMRKPKKSEVFETGPALAKKYPFGIQPVKQEEGPGIKTWLSTYVFSNFAESVYTFLGMAFTLLIIFSIIVTLRGFVCPDLATNKSKAWYCNLSASSEDEQK